MSDDQDTRDRLIRLEAEMDGVQKTIDAMSEKVSTMHDIMMQAKGARWLLLGTAGLLGFLASLLGKALPLWPGK